MPEAAIREIDGERLVRDSNGKWTPVEHVKPQHIDEDRTVRKIIAYAKKLNAELARFKLHTKADVTDFQARLSERYGGRRGGDKGNVTITSYDGCQKVVIQTQDTVSFGAELQVAKELVDACVATWSEGADSKIIALVQHAFQVDKEGRINRAALLQLRRLDIDDDHWRAAMEALNDAEKVIGSKEYTRFYERPNFKAKWEPIPIDLASA
ncbi:DUF3164 family protein [Hansschlegelia zhihuaiae]|uniref:DUF3164 family protein n=2 Tax=Hansschlegelia zhihuaiae TaxID=405005 RepID=A0A4Q0MNI7_9HYPH|nr:DUF3164 family protein [Hansschlegelia zhihuaiae]